MILKDAYFFNDERSVIKAIYMDKNENEIIKHIPAQENNAQYRKLLEQVKTFSEDTNPVDMLHERTAKYLTRSRNQFKDTVVAIAKEQGLVYDIDAIDTEIYKVIAKALFKDFDEEKEKQSLFLYKLTLFEMDFVKDCNDRDLKKELRKAKNLIDTTKIACEIYQKSQIL
jgi:hypothetical protein